MRGRKKLHDFVVRVRVAPEDRERADRLARSVGATFRPGILREAISLGLDELESRARREWADPSRRGATTAA